MEQTVTLQKFIRPFSTPLEVATKYLTLLSVLSGLDLTPREVQLLAFTATRGSISSGGARAQFMELYGSSKASIANMVHKLTQRGLLVKEGGKIRVHPQLSLDYTHPVILNLMLKHG